MIYLNCKKQKATKAKSLDLRFAILTLQMLGTSVKTIQAFDFSSSGIRLVLARLPIRPLRGSTPLYSTYKSTLFRRLIMYMHNDIVDEPMQSVVSVLTTNTTDHKDDDELDNLTSLDPLGERIWSIVSALFKDKSEVTIQDILDATDIKESPVRTRLSLLVKLNYLKSVNGTGRRPTYYFLPPTQDDPELASTEYVVKTLEKSLALKELEEKQLLTQLQIVSADKEAIQRTIKVLLAGGSSNV